jgi:hypothetical protein
MSTEYEIVNNKKHTHEMVNGLKYVAGLPLTCTLSHQRFRGGLVFKAHRLLYHSTLGSRVTKTNPLTQASVHDIHLGSLGEYAGHVQVLSLSQLILSSSIEFIDSI